MSKYQVIDKFIGYFNKVDITKLPPNALVSPSVNVILTESETIKIRNGYTLDGAANASLTPIESSFDWDTNTGVERNLRSYDDELEFRYVDPDDDSVTWTKILDGWTAVDFQYAVWWDIGEKQDVLLFVNGDSNIYSWSGCAAKIGVTTASTIQLLDTSTTWIEQRVVSGGSVTYDKIITINGTDYTYTGGETTDTLTGVTPNPSGEGSGSLAVQKPTTHTNKPGSDATTFSNDLIAVLDNQLWVGSLISNSIFVSKNTDFTDFTFSSPRAPGEGALLTLDGRAVGFAVQAKAMRISAAKSQWYQAQFTLSSDNTAEFLTVLRLKTGPQQGALVQSAIGEIKNFTAFISNEPTMDFLGQIENVNTPQVVPVSDPVKKDFDTFDLTNAHVKFFQNKLYTALPNQSKVLIFNFEKNVWEAPWDMPAGRFAIIGDELYLHSNAVPETYKLFQGFNDNDNPINARAIFAYNTYGDRVNQKDFVKKYTEGFIGLNTTITRTDRLDWEGSTQENQHDILGTDDTILFKITSENTLGQNPLGQTPLGSVTEEETTNSKFRIIKDGAKKAFYEKQTEFSSNDLDQEWELLAFGEDTTLSSENNFKITQ